MGFSNWKYLINFFSFCERRYWYNVCPPNPDIIRKIVKMNPSLANPLMNTCSEYDRWISEGDGKIALSSRQVTFFAQGFDNQKI